MISVKHYYILTFYTVMAVRLKDISNSTFTIITPRSVGTVMGTSSIVSETLIDICNSKNKTIMQL